MRSQLNWAEINPDIFGSMFQAVVHPDQRGGMGMHYTSVTNIMKVIEKLAVAHLNLKLSRLSWSTDRQPISFMSRSISARRFSSALSTPA